MLFVVAVVTCNHLCSALTHWHLWLVIKLKATIFDLEMLVYCPAEGQSRLSLSSD